jgi:hypothetical protein
LECRYQAAFQILGKHNFTPELSTAVKYADVRVSIHLLRQSVLHILE